MNQKISNLFERLAAILEIKGANRFKVIAFSKVARALKDLTYDIRPLVLEGNLPPIDGIGASSHKIIEEFVRTGQSADFMEAAEGVPPTLLDLMEIPGLGPKTIALLWKERNVTSVAELEKAIEVGALDGLKGIGEKKIQTIRQGIALRAAGLERMGIAEALPVAEELRQAVAQLPGVQAAQVAGSLRRGRETIGDVDILAAVADADQAEPATLAFTKLPRVKRVLGQGATKASVLTENNLQVDLRIVPPEHFGAALLYFTGSKDHNVKLRQWALDKHMTLNEWGLYDLDQYDKIEKRSGLAPDIQPLAAADEAGVYKKLGLDYIAPELREDRGELEAARRHQLPDLIEVKDIRGDLHCHTVASDGVNSIEEMALAAKALGYEYLAITDHSKSQTIAHGLTAERLLEHIQAIRQANDRVKGITLLAGSEVDILADGHLDYEDAILAELDVVIASPHVALTQDANKATDRLLRAIEHRHVNVIGHPTGRLINQREGLSPDMGRIFAAAAASGTALEINSGYPRLDLNDVNSRAAAAAGAKISINTDAHQVDQFGWITLGVKVARRGWLSASQVINCLSLKDLRKFLRAKK